MRRSPRESKNSCLANIQKLIGARILLVEDNEIFQEIVGRILDNAGIKVTIVNNGCEAIDILKKQSFDGILMDCQMPVMDGYEATAIIRRHPQWANIPIIAMTADTVQEDCDKYIIMGMNDYVAKPIDVNILFQALAAWIKPDYRESDLPTAPISVVISEELPQIDGLDLAAGLKVMAGNAQLYRKLLYKFREKYADFESKFREAQGDFEITVRMAHTLKGVAGNIGALNLMAAVAQLEEACYKRASKEEIEKKLDSVREHLRPLIAGLKAVD
ncbi:MAG: response regulator [Chitinophagales bacterium]